MKSLTNSDRIFLSFIAGIFCISASLLVKDILFPSLIREGEKIGTITFRNRYAEQKATSSTIWASLRQHSPVYNLDTIRTGSDSTALITLQNGTEIFLDEESMIFLSLDRKKTSVALSSGTARVNSIVSQEELTVTDGKNEVTLKGGSSALMKSSDNAENVEAINSPSFLTITTDSQDSVLEQTGEVVVAKAESIFPLNGETILASGSSVPITFSWTDIGPVRLLVSTDPSFKKNVVDEYITGASLEISLKDGVYYWKYGESPISWFTCLTGTSPKALSPDDKVYRLTGSSRDILLRWSHTSIDSLYRFSLINTEEPQSPLYQATLSQKNTRVEILKPGKYAWTVTALTGPEKNEYVSSTAFFSVEIDSLKPPFLTKEDDKESIIIPSGKPILSWEAETGALRYEVELYSLENPSNKVKTFSTTKNTVSLHDVPAGDYKVVARSISADTQSPWTEGTVLSIKAPVPIILTTPVVNETIPASVRRTGKISFMWDDDNLAQYYEMEISASLDMSSPLFVKKVSKSTFTISDFYPEESVLYWKITGYKADGTMIAGSEIRPLVLETILEDPVPLSPVDGKKFDLVNVSKLNFTWKKTEDAYAYRVKIYRMTALIPSLIGEWTTKNTQLTITDFTRFSLDHFAWDIQALYTDSSGTEKASPGVRSFFQIQQNKPLAVPSIKQMSTRGKF